MTAPAGEVLAGLADADQPVATFTSTPAVAGDLPAIDGLLAGAAEVDITPSPGMPRAGHSLNAHDGNGFRTRLRARVVHLRAGSTSLALVACDLLAGSAVLQHLVAEAVADGTDVRLPGLFLGATHTHAGPGNFHSSDFCNRFAANRGGLDPAHTSFLVERIAGAVRSAVAERRPARLAVGSTEVWGLTRNRSLDAHVRNDTVADKRTTAQRKYAAVNPWLHLLRVDAIAPDGGYEPLAGFAVFSIHGTGISQHDRSYNADVWAYLTGELVARVERSTGARIVAGAVEGTHGDVAPAVRPGLLVFPEAERVGRGIGEAAADLFERLEASLTDEVELAAGLREVDLDRDGPIDGISLPPGAVGAALLAGARENTSPVLHLLPPFRAGFPKPGGAGPHGAKWVVGSRWLQPWVVPSASFLRVLPFQVIRIGGVLLVGVPFETTVESGLRIERAVRAAVGSDAAIERVVVSSLANDQINYLTTPEEYAQQCYEGGNTTYGPQSQPFATAHCARLAADVLRHRWVADHLPQRRFTLRSHRYLARATGERVARAVVGEPTFVDPSVEEDACWQLEWRDVSPGDLAWHEPLVRVEAEAPPGWSTLTDDGGWHLGVTHLGRDRRGGGHRYAARWYAPPLGEPRRHRFVLLANRGQPELATPAFD